MAKICDKKFFLLGILIGVTTVLSAQEADFYKRMMKESIQMDFIFDSMDMMDMIGDSVPKRVELNILKKPLPSIGYNFKQNSLFLNHKDSIPLDRKSTISPYMTMDYTDPDSEETMGEVLMEGFYMPLAAIANVNPIALFMYLMKLGVLSDEPFVPRETKKAKALREIKEAYGVK